MSVLINKNTRVVVQGITGSAGSFHATQCMSYEKTQIVAGVTPGKGGTIFNEKVPVFNTLFDAIKETGADASLIFVPPAFAADSILEAINAKIKLIVCITEGIPVKDMIPVKAALKNSSSVLIGPNCPGIITPGECKMGIMPGYIHRPGTIGVVSRSGTLTYEAVWQLTQRGYGQSTCIGIGGDPIIGINHKEAVKFFNDDPNTEAIVMIGEIGGNAEVEAAEFIKQNVRKPVVSFIAGTTAPKGKRMGHAGAIVSGEEDSAEAKIKKLLSAGILISQTPSSIGETMAKALS